MDLKLKSGKFNLPVFFPDATHGFVKGLATQDLINAKVQGLVINTYHAIVDETVERIAKLGGLHKFISFNGPIITDSGGFQVMSLIHRNPSNGKITEDGIKFKIQGKKAPLWLTPENCIQTQIKLGADIIMCLDDCTDPSQPHNEQEVSIERTVRWAKRCKDEFEKLTLDIEITKKPRLFSIIQGGNSKELRKECAEKLVKIGFDGFGFGGWPVDGERNFLTEIVDYTASLMPDDKPKYAMGVGKPQDIVSCVTMGYNMFDCVLPTRDARHERLYIFDGSKEKFGYIHIGSSKYVSDTSPISEMCDCETCKHYSRAYLHHLFKQKDSAAIRLATIHNLRFYSMLMETFEDRI